ncbi:hypothetical protein J8J04_00735 ['Fragaria x ananassa' phyllody phytoplasma]|uniref:Uncharacterized protein n=1 Tax='Fragaria x ananassa' phyllody phytoplasma TaxID=2358428 RepID=A0ABS5K2X1_9MOLU|nr:hypothetical protein ['Fragaria x ananassa' phyllody phytoplasma]MBS2126232.1 hypothetical protein ['Fragaria x ananassa' phyllody phytoplasma]
MLTYNVYQKQKLLRQIILTAFFSCIPLVLSQCFKEIRVSSIKVILFPLSAFTLYFVFFPIILLSFYVPCYLACLGAFLADVFNYLIVDTNPKFCYEPLSAMMCVLSFALIPSLFLKKTDHIVKFYFVILISSLLFQMVDWVLALKYRYHIDVCDAGLHTKLTQILSIIKTYFLIRLPFVFIVSLVMVIMIKELLKRLSFLTSSYYK